MSPTQETCLLSAETDDERKEWIRAIKQFLYSVSGGGKLLCISDMDNLLFFLVSVLLLLLM